MWSTKTIRGVPNEIHFYGKCFKRNMEKAGVKGRITRDLISTITYNDSVIIDKLHQWVNKNQGKFPKSTLSTEMTVEKVCYEWPDWAI